MPPWATDVLRLVAAVGLPVAAGLVLWLYQRRRLARYSDLGPTCERCGYLLVGLTEPRCPECGEPFEEREDDDQADLRG